MDDIPTTNECLRFLIENGCSESVICHCKTVAKLSVKIAKNASAESSVGLVIVAISILSLFFKL